VEQLARDGPLAADRGARRLELLAAGEPPRPEQEADFLEARLLGELVDVDPAIGQDAPRPVDVADRGVRRDDILEAPDLDHGLSLAFDRPRDDGIEARELREPFPSLLAELADELPVLLLRVVAPRGVFRQVQAWD